MPATLSQSPPTAHRQSTPAVCMLEMTPGERAGEIRHATVTTAMGPALIAATPRGICWLSFGGTGDELRELQQQWPGATYVHDEALQLGDTVALDGTAFQMQVWRALVDIPAGQTRTYGELAKILQRPAASRAVGAACGANRVSLLVPCHRVVGSTGKLTGFRWGEDVKRRLLESEQATLFTTSL